MTTTEELIEALEAADYEWREYSGRGMMGARCVGVVLQGDADLWRLARDLAEIEDLPTPKTDGMGKDIIAYWPRLKIIDDAA